MKPILFNTPMVQAILEGRKKCLRSKAMREFVIDLFCGAGGTSAGVHLSEGSSTVTACVNHDLKAIESHRLNHPSSKHFVEDIRNPEVVWFLKLRVNALRKLYPNCIITIWASLECTNFSKAKGGLPRDADSRTLADHLFMYLDGINPDYLMIENVMEFMAWGPLDEKGKPVSMRRGKDYIQWVNKVRSYGYRFDWKELNSADYGAYTSRTRYFAQFAKGDLPINWPEKTHAKDPGTKDNLFNDQLKPWKPVREVLDLDNEGKSIFKRNKPLVENTLKRIYAGLVKFVANGDNIFIKKYYSGRPEGKVITVNGPAGTVTTVGGQGIVRCDFLQSYYGNGQPHSQEEPCPTVPTKDKFGKVTTHFIDQQYGNSKPAGIDQPLGTITQNPKYAQVKTEPWIMNNTGCEGFPIPVHEDDTKTMVKIKQFMAYYGIADIKMRMLEVQELLRIQGFPEGYELVGNQTEQKKFIGNSVEVTTATAIFEAHHEALEDYFKNKLAAA